MLWYPPHNSRSSGKVTVPEKIILSSGNSCCQLLSSSFQGKPFQDRWTASAFTSGIETVFIPK